MRTPDLIIGTRERPQTFRWNLFKWRVAEPSIGPAPWHVPRDGCLQLALHKWVRSDDDRALHDHSSWNVSLLLWGTYLEVFEDRIVRRRPLVPYFRRAGTPHRVLLIADPSGRTHPVWTLWLRGPPWRDWGFHCPKGWRHWRDYISTRDYSASGSVSDVGKGCD
jgi:hypothetical protein